MKRTDCPECRLIGLMIEAAAPWIVMWLFACGVIVFAA